MTFRLWMISLSALIAVLIGFKLHHSSPGPAVPPTPIATRTATVQPPAPRLTAPPVAAPVEDFAADPESTNTEVVAVNTNAVSVPDDLEVRMQLMEKLRNLGETNFAAALQMVQQMGEGEERDDALQAICYGLARKDPARAVAEADKLQQPAPVMENLVQQWAGKDVPAATVWANNQPAGDNRNELFQRIGYVLSQNDPRNAANLVVEQIPAGPAQNEAVMSVLHQWANKDMLGAVDWVKTFPESAFRERALQELEGIETYQKALANH